MRNNSVLDLDTFSVLREFCVYAKVFGERNSGTNFVQKIIQANFGVHCLQNNNPIYDYVRAASRRLPKELKGIFRSTIVDMDCQRILASDFGWKHGIPPENEILSAPHAKHTLFVCVAKHPLAWLGSLVSRPYNPAESAPSNFSDFIRYDWPLSPRDNLPDRDRINVVELWNAKNSAFLNLSTIVDRCIVVAYERILEDPAGFLDRVACHLLSTREKYVWSLASTKGDETTFEEYREKYLTERIDDAISADDLEFVRQRIDFDLLESFGYTWPAA